VPDDFLNKRERGKAANLIGGTGGFPYSINEEEEREKGVFEDLTRGHNVLEKEDFTDEQDRLVLKRIFR